MLLNSIVHKFQSQAAKEEKEEEEPESASCKATTDRRVGPGGFSSYKNNSLVHEVLKVKHKYLHSNPCVRVCVCV